MVLGWFGFPRTRMRSSRRQRRVRVTRLGGKQQRKHITCIFVQQSLKWEHAMVQKEHVGQLQHYVYVNVVNRNDSRSISLHVCLHSKLLFAFLAKVGSEH